jgi:hypothetical protein
LPGARNARVPARGEHLGGSAAKVRLGEDVEHAIEPGRVEPEKNVSGVTSDSEGERALGAIVTDS